MQSQVSASAALSPVLENGAALTRYAANAVVPAAVDFIKATGGVAGIQLTLTSAIYQTGNPASPTLLYQTYYAMKDDAGVGAVSFVDPNGALFNGQSSYELTDQYQWAIMVWDGIGWHVLGN
jgi:hypothetical protein